MPRVTASPPSSRIDGGGAAPIGRDVRRVECFMARGWESKSVDDQQASAEAARADRHRVEPTPAERARKVERETLLLNRARTLQTLQAACDRRHRALLEQTLAHLDAAIAATDGPAEDEPSGSPAQSGPRLAAG